MGIFVHPFNCFLCYDVQRLQLVFPGNCINFCAETLLLQSCRL